MRSCSHGRIHSGTLCCLQLLLTWSFGYIHFLPVLHFLPPPRTKSQRECSEDGVLGTHPPENCEWARGPVDSKRAVYQASKEKTANRTSDVKPLGWRFESTHTPRRNPCVSFGIHSVPSDVTRTDFRRITRRASIDVGHVSSSRQTYRRGLGTMHVLLHRKGRTTAISTVSSFPLRHALPVDGSKADLSRPTGPHTARCSSPLLLSDDTRTTASAAENGK